MNLFEKEFSEYDFGFRTNTDEDWYPSDTEELFNSNLKKYPDSIHLKNYKNNPIKYSLNNFGFRTPDDFTLDDIGNVFLGCSHTFGVGHHLENTWAYNLSKKIGGKFYNISEPGSGVMTQYRLLKYFSNTIKFNNVYHFLPNECWGRFEYPFSSSYFENLDLRPDSNHAKLYKNWIDSVIFNDTWRNTNIMVYIDAIKHICTKNNSNYFLITDSYVKEINPYHETMIPARDIQHYYVEEHIELVDKFNLISR